jgi:hypothetical protein
MTHDPCRYNCCVPPTARDAVERQQENMRRRKRDMLQDVQEAARWNRPFIVPWENRDAADALISDGLVVETVEGLKPHPQ